MQIARAHAHGFQRLQQAQRHSESVHQLVELFKVIAACKTCGQFGQGVGQVTIVVERLDQIAQCGTVEFGQAQRQGLAVQKVGE